MQLQLNTTLDQFRDETHVLKLLGILLEGPSLKGEVIMKDTLEPYRRCEHSSDWDAILFGDFCSLGFKLFSAPDCPQ